MEVVDEPTPVQPVAKSRDACIAEINEMQRRKERDVITMINKHVKMTMDVEYIEKLKRVVKLIHEVLSKFEESPTAEPVPELEDIPEKLADSTVQECDDDLDDEWWQGVFTETFSNSTLDYENVDVRYYVLMAAIQICMPDVVEILLKHASINPDGIPPYVVPLSIACRCTDVQQRGAMVRMLLKNGANPNIPFKFIDIHTRAQDNPADNDTPMSILQLAATQNDDNIVRQLIEYKADLEAPASSRIPSPLSLACGGGLINTVATLIHNGVNVNTKSGPSNTVALMMTLNYCPVDSRLPFIVEMLVKAGADAGQMYPMAPESTPCGGINLYPIETPLIAIIKKILLLLGGPSGPLPHPCFIAEEEAHEQVKILTSIIPMFMKDGMDPNCTESGKMNSVFKDIKTGKFTTLEVPSNKEKKTALQLALSTNCTDLIQIILAHGADPNVPTPLSTLESAMDATATAHIERLFEHGLCFDTRNNTLCNNVIASASVTELSWLTKQYVDNKIPASKRYLFGSILRKLAEHGFDIVSNKQSRGVLECAGMLPMTDAGHETRTQIEKVTKILKKIKFGKDDTEEKQI